MNLSHFCEHGLRVGASQVPTAQWFTARVHNTVVLRTAILLRGLLIPACVGLWLLRETLMERPLVLIQVSAARSCLYAVVYFGFCGSQGMPHITAASCHPLKQALKYQLYSQLCDSITASNLLTLMPAILPYHRELFQSSSHMQNLFILYSV